MPIILKGRLGFFLLSIFYGAIVAACAYSLIVADAFNLGRNPWANLMKTLQEFSYPSFLDVWWGNSHLEYRSDDGRVLRTENRPLVEKEFLSGVARATWTTFTIATLGSLLGAIMALPLAVLASRNLYAPKPLAFLAKIILNVARSIHTLVFGLILVGIVGLGPMAGIMAIALHSMGTYGKLFAETIESLDMLAIDAVKSVGATPSQVFFNAVWPTVLPQCVSIHLYVWEFNIRDSTILGLVGAGGLGLLITEATALFQWGRLSTLLLVVVIMVSLFDTLSRKLREALV